MLSITRRRLLAGAGTSLLPGALLAQSGWPNKPVRIVVPFAPAGTTDILARALAPELSKAFGQTFIIDNKPGAGGNLGADLIAKSPPDGYNLLMGTVGTHAINAALYPRMAFDPVRDFTPIVLVAGVPAGASRPNHELASNPLTGPASAIVGRSGNAALR